MKWTACCLMSSALTWSVACVEHASAADDDASSSTWQPENASGAEGTGFVVKMEAKPTTLAAEDPLTLTIRITATGAWQRPPKRPDLAAFREFKSFDIAPPTSTQPDRTLPTERAWEFDYRLRPLTADVRKIPGIAFRYYNPQIPLPERRWQTTFADPIALHVQPRPSVRAQDVPGAKVAPNLPPAIYQFTSGPELVRLELPFTYPGLALAVCLLLLPPALCLGAGVWWNRRHPSAGRRQRRLSRAARQALTALARMPRDENQASRATAIVSSYLRHRVDLPPADVTPGDIETRLQRDGYPQALAAQGAAFFRAGDAARFGPVVDTTGATLPDAAAQLIRALEEAPA